MTPTTVPAQPPAAKSAPRPIPGGSVLFDGIDWETYERLLDAFDNRHVFLTYDRGRLEIMAPLWNHEWWKGRVRIVLPVLCGELNLEIQGAGSTTMRRQDLERGLEADEWFYIQNAARMTGLRVLDLRRDPPPDLALEVEATRSALDRLAIYEALGVREVWRYDGEAIHVHRLRQDGHYEVVPDSPTFPALPLAEFVQFIDQTQGLGEVALTKAFRTWVRQHVLPRLQSPPAAPLQ